VATILVEESYFNSRRDGLRDALRRLVPASAAPKTRTVPVEFA
jgi:hypothetical protein